MKRTKPFINAGTIKNGIHDEHFPAERRIRALLPLIRWMQLHPPLRLAKRYLQKRVAKLRPHKDVMNRSETIDGVRCQWLIPPDCPEKRVLLYLHGGGFVFGLTCI